MKVAELAADFRGVPAGAVAVAAAAAILPVSLRQVPAELFRGGTRAWPAVTAAAPAAAAVLCVPPEQHEQAQCLRLQDEFCPRVDGSFLRGSAKTMRFTWGSWAETEQQAEFCRSRSQVVEKPGFMLGCAGPRRLHFDNDGFFHQEFREIIASRPSLERRGTGTCGQTRSPCSCKQGTGAFSCTDSRKLNPRALYPR